MDLTSATEGQRRIITTLDAPLSVAAGAGSGKTFTLTNRIAYALVGEEGTTQPFIGRVDEVLATTFSKSGAAEMKSRIRALLQQEGLDEQALMIEDAWITTIHGMCARILREHALELGIDPGFEVVENVEADELWQQALDSVLEDLSEEDNSPLKRLFDWYPETKASFGSESISVLITKLWEKTLGMPNGFESVVLSQARFDHRRSLRCMIEVAQSYERLALSVGEQANKAILNNIDALQAPIAQAHRYLEQIDASQIDFLSMQDCLDYLEVLFLFPKLESSRAKVRPDAEALEGYRSTYAEIAHAAVADVSVRISADLLELTRLVDRGYQQLKGANRLDNADLLRSCAHALATHPSIAKGYQERFKLIMVDEFQDTDLLQVSIIDKLSREHGANVMTVGDAQQTLYRFRGADVEVFFDHRSSQEQAHENLQALSLPDNFRSHGDVLAFVETIFSRPEFFGDRFLALQAHGAVNKEVDPRFCESPRIQVEVIEARSRSKGGSISDARKQSARSIAAHFAALHDEGVSPSEMVILLGTMNHADCYMQALADAGFESVISGGSVFALAPEVQLIDALLSALANKRNSSALYAVLSSPLFNLSDAAFLALAQFEPEGEAVPLVRSSSFAQRFWFFVDRLAAVGEDAALELLGSYQLAEEERTELIRALQLFGRLSQQASQEGLYQALHAFILDAGWFYRLQAAGSDGQAVAANIFKALDLVLSWEQQQQTMPQIADRFTCFLVSSKEKPGVLATLNSNYVRIMTIHASKGLEFGHVAIAEAPLGLPKSTKLAIDTLGDKVLYQLTPKLSGNAEKTYSGLMAYLDSSDLDTLEVGSQLDELAPEELALLLDARIARATLDDAERLLYVALTRASRSLFLSLTFDGNKDFNYSGKGIYGLLHKVLQWETTPEASVSTFEYGGSAPALIRHEVLTEKPEEQPAPVAEQQEFIVPPVRATQALALTVPGPRHDVVSYSAIASAHGQMLVQEAGDEVFEEQDADEEMFSGEEALEIKRQLAFTLGTAFHRLAQRAIESRREVGVVPELSAEAFQAQVRQGGLSPEAGQRLAQAVERWFLSDLCKRFFACEHIYAEVPFMLEIGSGERPLYLEGEIDGLAVSEADKDHAFFIDYKTGGSDEESPEQLHEKHLLQAQCYALALMRQGFETVEAHFIRVERESKSDPAQPQVVPYRFTVEERATLEEAVLSAYEARKSKESSR